MTAPNLARIAERWPLVLEHVRAADPTAAILLEAARPAALHGRTVIVYLRDGAVGAVLDAHRGTVFDRLADALGVVCDDAGHLVVLGLVFRPVRFDPGGIQYGPPQLLVCERVR